MPRATEHNGRTRSNGEVYSPKHNDRQFNTGNSRHIDGSLSENNDYYFCEADAKTQDENESLFYTKHFRVHLEAQNERYIQQRHADKVKTIDQYRGSKQTCPEETIYQLGTAKEKDVSAEELLAIVKEQIKWIEETYSQVKIIDYAMHLDEPNCAPHIHVRRVWIAHDNDGNEIVNQSKALEEMGIKAPKEDEATNRYNNPKVTFTLACRDHYETLCHERGIELPKERKEASEVGLEFKDYKRKVIEKKIEELNIQNEKLTEQNNQLTAHITALTEDKKKLTDENKKLIEEKEKAEAELDHALEIINSNKPAVLPETRKTVRNIVHSIDDLNKREAENKVKEKELNKREISIQKTESKLRLLADKLDIDKIIQGIIKVFMQLIYVFADEIYKKLRQFLMLKHKEKLLEEFDKCYTQEKMWQFELDLSKQIKEAEKELDTTMQEYKESPLDLGER